jgi:hypothetical protein
MSDTVLPTGDVVIRDDFESGQPNYREFFYSLVGLAGEGQNVDGNGPYVRFQPGGGSTTVSLGGVNYPGGQLFSNVFGDRIGTQPKKPSRKPPYDASVPCHRSPKPDLNGPWSAKGSFGTIVDGPEGGSTP